MKSIQRHRAKETVKKRAAACISRAALFRAQFLLGRTGTVQ
jgi:hypothetical protein